MPPWGYAALSVLLGLVSLGLALLEPRRGGVASGFLVSSVGLTAIALGVRAMRVGPWRSPTSRALGRGGIILGSVGSALMAYAVVATALVSTGVTLPALGIFPGDTAGQTILRGMPLPVTTEAPGSTARDDALDGRGDSTAGAPVDDAAGGQDAAAPPAAAPGSAADTGTADGGALGPGFPVVVDRRSEANALAISAGTLAYRFRHTFTPGTLPLTLTVGMSSPERILLADGTPLAPVPDGTRVLYQVSDDRTQWSVTLVGSSYGAVSSFSSAVGQVQAG